MTWIPVLLSILLVSFISWILLRESTLIQKALGHTGTNVVERLLGIFILVMAVQFVFNGIAGYLLTLMRGVTLKVRLSTSIDELILLGFQAADLTLWAHRSTRRSLKALPMTDSELNVIAAAAMMGLSNIPKKG